MFEITTMDLKNEREAEEEEEDYFDHLPDALLLLIFNKLIDAPSLIRCLIVSKRFASLIPQSDTVFLSLPLPSLHSKPKSRLGRRFLFRKFICWSIRFVRHMIARNSANSASTDWYYWPNIALKEFKHITFVHLELPSCGGEIGSNADGDLLLKWKAKFGGVLKSCVVLCASSLRRKSPFPSDSDADEIGEEEEESVLNDEELKLRIVWTISSLIAASMRHYIVKQMVTNFPKLRSVVITDSSKQGRLCMGENQVSEVRNSLKSSAVNQAPMERTRIPDLNMTMWHVPKLDLPASGFVMKAATLVIVRPCAGMTAKGVETDVLEDDFDAEGEGEGNREAYSEAVKELMKFKMNYVLEVNSF